MKNSIIAIKWFVALELNHSSYIYTSLVELCKLEKIKFKISSKNLNRKGRISIEQGNTNFSTHLNPKINWLQIKFDNGDIKNIAFDLNDDPKCFGVYALNKADVYYKRCYQEDIINVLSEHREKIRPLGLPFMVRPDNFLYLRKLKLYFYLFKIIEIFKLDRLLIKRFRRFKIKAVQHFDGFRNTRSVSDFKNFNPEVSGNIFYQKRLFEEASDDVRRLNQQRIRIIRILKNNFTDNFYGGLQKNRISNPRYSELISNIDGNQHTFLEAIKKCGICIYTNGLKGSPGWTLPEYLSQGKCIIAERLDNTLPFPLINGQHLMYYSNEEELVKICNELLNDPGKRIHLGRNARKYYEDYIDPKVFFKNLLIANFE